MLRAYWQTMPLCRNLWQSRGRCWNANQSGLGRPPRQARFHSLDCVLSIWRHAMTDTKLFVVATAQECLVCKQHRRRNRETEWEHEWPTQRWAKHAKATHALVSKDTSNDGRYSQQVGGSSFCVKNACSLERWFKVFCKPMAFYSNSDNETKWM